MKDEGGTDLNRVAAEPPVVEVGCPSCDGIGCMCMRTRDWQSIDLGCHSGCPECGRNTCRPPDDSEGVESVYDATERPVMRTDGSRLWDALDSTGHGHILGFASPLSVELWLDGYETGAQENM